MEILGKHKFSGKPEINSGDKLVGVHESASDPTVTDDSDSAPTVPTDISYSVDTDGNVSLDGAMEGVMSSNGEYLVFADTVTPDLYMGVGVKSASVVETCVDVKVGHVDGDIETNELVGEPGDIGDIGGHIRHERRLSAIDRFEERRQLSVRRRIAKQDTDAMDRVEEAVVILVHHVPAQLGGDGGDGDILVHAPLRWAIDEPHR